MGKILYSFDVQIRKFADQLSCHRQKVEL